MHVGEEGLHCKWTEERLGNPVIVPQSCGAVIQGDRSLQGTEEVVLCLQCAQFLFQCLHPFVEVFFVFVESCDMRSPALIEIMNTSYIALG